MGTQEKQKREDRKKSFVILRWDDEGTNTVRVRGVEKKHRRECTREILDLKVEQT